MTIFEQNHLYASGFDRATGEEYNEGYTMADVDENIQGLVDGVKQVTVSDYVKSITDFYMRNFAIIGILQMVLTIILLFKSKK